MIMDMKKLQKNLEILFNRKVNLSLTIQTCGNPIYEEPEGLRVTIKVPDKPCNWFNECILPLDFLEDGLCDESEKYFFENLFNSFIADIKDGKESIKKGDFNNPMFIGLGEDTEPSS